MPYLVIDSDESYTDDGLIVSLTVELGAVLSNGPFADAPASQRLYDLLADAPVFSTYEPFIHISARLERRMRMKYIQSPETQWVIDTDGLISAMVNIPTQEDVWPTPGQYGSAEEEMQFTLRANMDILGDFDCLAIPDLTVCIRREDPKKQARLEQAIGVWEKVFPDSPVMVVDPDVDYQDILQVLDNPGV